MENGRDELLLIRAERVDTRKLAQQTPDEQELIPTVLQQRSTALSSFGKLPRDLLAKR